MWFLWETVHLPLAIAMVAVAKFSQKVDLRDSANDRLSLTSVFHKSRGISLPAKRIQAYQELLHTVSSCPSFIDRRESHSVQEACAFKAKCTGNSALLFITSSTSRQAYVVLMEHFTLQNTSLLLLVSETFYPQLQKIYVNFF
jgi:hypothetical protein